MPTHIYNVNIMVTIYLGALFKTRCLRCGRIEENRQSPIVPSLLGKG